MRLLYSFRPDQGNELFSASRETVWYYPGITIDWETSAAVPEPEPSLTVAVPAAMLAFTDRGCCSRCVVLNRLSYGIAASPANERALNG